MHFASAFRFDAACGSPLSTQRSMHDESRPHPSTHAVIAAQFGS